MVNGFANRTSTAPGHQVTSGNWLLGLEFGMFANKDAICLRRKGPMSKVTIEIDSRWEKIVRSPIYYIVASMQGLSVSFAPLFLYWSGRDYFPGAQSVVVPLCFATIISV